MDGKNVLEQLVNGTLPSAISPNIVSQSAIDIPREKFIVQEILSINFIRSFRTVLQIIGETLVDYCIGKVDQWDQLFSDSTGRCKTPIQNIRLQKICAKANLTTSVF